MFPLESFAHFLTVDDMWSCQDLPGVCFRLLLLVIGMTVWSQVIPKWLTWLPRPERTRRSLASRHGCVGIHGGGQGDADHRVKHAACWLVTSKVKEARENTLCFFLDSRYLWETGCNWHNGELKKQALSIVLGRKPSNLMCLPCSGLSTTLRANWLNGRCRQMLRNLALEICKVCAPKCCWFCFWSPTSPKLKIYHCCQQVGEGQRNNEEQLHHHHHQTPMPHI